VSSGGTTLAEQLLGEPMSQQPFANIQLSNRQGGRHGDIRIEGYQRRVIQLLCVRVQPIELVRPATNDDDLVEPEG
jgi:hypothetical protein